MSDGSQKALIQNPVIAGLVLIVAGLIDTVVTPVVLSLPTLLVLSYAPEPANAAGLLLLALPVAYMLAYLFIRDTDDAWPIGPAERVLFS